ncbi:flavocytochrome c [uncultured Parasutterella sp.]|uniref:FAD-dependent oxidoreductase n=1 Tax=uncultured Parasutterella sp. TaxID=1263098 RepID=UPI00260E915F|nr:flavocytochrome c [uncultured Parasutterella sp.]
MFLKKLTLVFCCSLLPLEAFGLTTVDVVVVGGGAAGLAAAVSAAEHNAKVVLLEKSSSLGGNAFFSGGYFNAVNSERQKKAGVVDSKELYIEHMLESGGGKNSPEIVRKLAEESLETMKWLENKGLRFQELVTESFGGRWRRSYLTLEPDGQGFIRVLTTDALRRGVQIQTKAPVKQLLKGEDGRIVGVAYQDEDREEKRIFATKGVILAAGGFSANPELIRKIAPELSDLTNDNLAQNTGEVLLSAEQIGAKLVNMSEIECLPGARKGSTVRGRLHGDSSRFIFLDSDGKRFIREDAKRSEIRDAVLKLPGKMAYLVIDNSGFKSYSLGIQRDSIRGVETGDVFRADSIEEMAEQLKIDPSRLKKTIEEYNKCVDMGIDPLGKSKEKLLHKIETPPFWGTYAPMAIHNTLGGLAITQEGKVLDKDGKPISGLFAAGEITGMTHGSDRLGGNGLTEALTFGRISGKACAELK